MKTPKEVKAIQLIETFRTEIKSVSSADAERINRVSIKCAALHAEEMMREIIELDSTKEKDYWVSIHNHLVGLLKESERKLSVSK